jgi:hypothetical protein
VSLTADISQSFVVQFVADCATILRCNPLDLVSVTFSESDCRTRAHNPNGDASGLWQFMPATLRGLGWNARDCEAGLPAFRELDHLGQWIWFRRFFRPHAGKLVSRAACYVATFLPADLELAADPDAVLVEKGGRRGWAYAPNAGFDHDHDARIVVRELEDAIARAESSPRAVELLARIRREVQPLPSDAPVTLDPIAEGNHHMIEDALRARK